ncbi:MAG: hypothetical protein ACK5CA_17770 [Cyanobacteriota bacterium]
MLHKKKSVFASFNTEPDETMGFRMLDYRVWVHRRFPNWPITSSSNSALTVKPIKTAPRPKLETSSLNGGTRYAPFAIANGG